MIYGVNFNYRRWLRLLFGREFLFENLLILWDAIFAVNSNFALVRYISLALLIIQRQTSKFLWCLVTVARTRK